MATVEKKLMKKYEIKLKDYEYVKDPTKLKEGTFIRYIKKKTATAPEKLAWGGKLIEIMYDKDDKKKVYKIKLESNLGGSWIIKIENVHLFNKKKTTTEKRKQNVEEWKKALTPYERRKFNEMKKKRSQAKSTQDKKQISKEFYDWLDARKKK